MPVSCSTMYDRKSVVNERREEKNNGDSEDDERKKPVNVARGILVNENLGVEGSTCSAKPALIHNLNLFHVNLLNV